VHLVRPGAYRLSDARGSIRFGNNLTGSNGGWTRAYGASPTRSDGIEWTNSLAWSGRWVAQHHTAYVDLRRGRSVTGSNPICMFGATHPSTVSCTALTTAEWDRRSSVNVPMLCCWHKSSSATLCSFGTDRSLVRVNGSAEHCVVIQCPRWPGGANSKYIELIGSPRPLSLSDKLLLSSHSGRRYTPYVCTFLYAPYGRTHGHGQTITQK